jgi:hypothetical protein
MRPRLAPLLAITALVCPARADYGDLPAQDVQPQADVVLRAPDAPTTTGKSGIDFEVVVAADYLAPPIRGGTNPFGVGFGGRAGLVSSHFYAGFAIVDYLGGSDVTLSDSSLLAGGEVGWDFVIHSAPHFRLVLRPVLGLGDAAVSHTDPSVVTNAKPDVVTTASGRTVSSRNGPSPTTTINNVYIRPELALVLVHDWQMLALVGSGLVVPGISYGGADASTWLSYGVQLQAGVRF